MTDNESRSAGFQLQKEKPRRSGMQTIKPITSLLVSGGGIQRDSSARRKAQTLRCEDKKTGEGDDR